MKNTKIIIVINVFLLLVCVFCLCSCQRVEPIKLEAPNVRIVLKTDKWYAEWDNNSNVEWYTVEVNGIEYDTEETVFDLENIPNMDYGKTYKVKVKAMGNDETTLTSSWSETATDVKVKVTNDLVFNLIENDTAYEVTTYGVVSTKRISDIVLPDYYNDKPVTRLAYWGFDGHNVYISSIRFPLYLTSIGESCFSQCSFGRMTIPDSVTTLEGGVFAESNFESVTLPKNITELSDGLFRQTNLKNIDIPNSVTKIGISVFKDCTELKSIVVPDSVTELGRYVFQGCTSLKNLTMSKNLKKVGAFAFEGTACLEERSDGYVFFEDWLCDYKGEMSPDTVLTPSNLPIDRCGNKVAGGVFAGCTNLVGFEFPQDWSVTEFMFDGCSNLKSVILPDAITEIPENAFSKCASLESIKIPDNVTKIGNSAFSRCSKLNNVIVPSSVTEIGGTAFGNCTALDSIQIPDSVILGTSVFSQCYALPEMILPKAMTEIPDNMYWGCIAIREIIIPDNVTKIGKGAFRGCRGLESIYISDSVTQIDNNAFVQCISLRSITIPNSVAFLGNQVFAGTALTALVLPASITSLGSQLFYYCTTLPDLYFGGTAEQWSKIQIGDKNSELEKLTIYYYSETQPTESGNYWYYKDGVPTKWSATQSQATSLASCDVVKKTDCSIDKDLPPKREEY